VAEPDRQLLLPLVEQSEQALLARISGLGDDDAVGESTLPGWTRGHVLTHLARNAETLADILDGARRGEITAMYGGSVDVRDADIERGAGRSVPELVDDVQRTSSRLREGLRALAEPDWGRQFKNLRGEQLDIEEIVTMRWQEVEIHHLDLAVGYRPADWPAEFVEPNLARQLARLPERAPGVAPPELAPYDVLAWLYGRGGPGLPELPPWP